MPGVLCYCILVKNKRAVRKKPVCEGFLFCAGVLQESRRKEQTETSYPSVPISYAHRSILRKNAFKVSLSAGVKSEISRLQ